MKRSHAVTLVFVSLSVVLAEACFVDYYSGECGARILTVSVPESRAADVSAVSFSGLACGALNFYCQTPGGEVCEVYVQSGGIQGSGTCTVTVEFKSGAPPFVVQVNYERRNDDCGSQPSPPGVDVPEVSDSGAGPPG